jgi:hypothetical protein
MAACCKALDKVEREVQSKYDALLIVRGSSPIVDLANNHRLHDLILLFPESCLAGEMMTQVLEKGLVRWGW